MKKRTWITITIIATLGCVISAYFIVDRTPYREYSDRWAFRGEEKNVAILDTIQPINLADSMFAIHQAQDQFKNEVRNELKATRPDVGAITGLIGAIMALIFGTLKYLQDISNKKTELIFDGINKKITTQHEENKDQHTKIFEMLEIVKDNTVRKSITDALRKIGMDYMHYQKGIIPDEFRKLIEGQTERLIELTEQIMTESFTQDVLELAEVKIDEQSRKAWTQVEELFGSDFLIRYKCAQHHATKMFKAELADIVSDTVFNHKYERYSRVAQLFLNTLIQNTVKEYINFMKYEKIN